VLLAGPVIQGCRTCNSRDILLASNCRMGVRGSPFHMIWSCCRAICNSSPLSRRFSKILSKNREPGNCQRTFHYGNIFGRRACICWRRISIHGWHITFIVFGMLFFIAALAVLLTAPDDRNDMRIDAEIRLISPRPELTDNVKFGYFVAWFTSPAPFLLASAGCLRFMAGFCLTSFLPVYFQKHVVKDPTRHFNIFLSNGIITTVSGCISVMSGGFHSDCLVKYKVFNAPAPVSAAGSLAAVPLT
jgi:Na+/melibiose symporter-like transporter